MTMDLDRVRNLVAQAEVWVAQIRAELDRVDPSIPPPYPSTLPQYMRPARAYDPAKALWQAAQRGDIEGVTFNIHDFVGEGIRPFAQQFTEPKKLDEEALCKEVERIGRSEGGKKWLAVDANAAMLDWDWQMFFNGQVVRRASNNPDDGFVRR